MNVNSLIEIVREKEQTRKKVQKLLSKYGEKLKQLELFESPEFRLIRLDLQGQDICDTVLNLCLLRNKPNQTLLREWRINAGECWYLWIKAGSEGAESELQRWQEVLLRQFISLSKNNLVEHWREIEASEFLLDIFIDYLQKDTSIGNLQFLEAAKCYREQNPELARRLSRAATKSVASFPLRWEEEWWDADWEWLDFALKSMSAKDGTGYHHMDLLEQIDTLLRDDTDPQKRKKLQAHYMRIYGEKSNWMMDQVGYCSEKTQAWIFARLKKCSWSRQLLRACWNHLKEFSGTASMTKAQLFFISLVVRHQPKMLITLWDDMQLENEEVFKQYILLMQGNQSISNAQILKALEAPAIQGDENEIYVVQMYCSRKKARIEPLLPLLNSGVMTEESQIHIIKTLGAQEKCTVRCILGMLNRCPIIEQDVGTALLDCLEKKIKAAAKLMWEEVYLGESVRDEVLKRVAVSKEVTAGMIVYKLKQETRYKYQQELLNLYLAKGGTVESLLEKEG